MYKNRPLLDPPEGRLGSLQIALRSSQTVLASPPPAPPPDEDDVDGSVLFRTGLCPKSDRAAWLPPSIAAPNEPEDALRTAQTPNARNTQDATETQRHRKKEDPGERGGRKKAIFSGESAFRGQAKAQSLGG